MELAGETVNLPPLLMVPMRCGILSLWLLLLLVLFVLVRAGRRA
jgi:hypothetical protein